MGFNDFLENGQKHRNYFRGRYSHDEIRHPYDSHYQDDNYDNFHGYTRHNRWLILLEKVRSNGKLRAIMAIASVLILIIGIILIIVLLPVIIKLIKAISETGIQGIIESASGFLEKLWKGTSN